MKKLIPIAVIFTLFFSGCAQTKFLEKNFEFDKVYVADIGKHIAHVSVYEFAKCQGEAHSDEDCFEVYGFNDFFSYGGMMAGDVKIDYISNDVERYGEYVNPSYTRPIFINAQPGDTLWIEYLLIEVVAITNQKIAYRILECEVPEEYLGTEWRTITANK